MRGASGCARASCLKRAGLPVTLSRMRPVLFAGRLHSRTGRPLCLAVAEERQIVLFIERVCCCAQASMNARQGILVTLFSASLFVNCAASLWTMWSVLTTSLFMLMITDFMFFAVRPPRNWNTSELG